MAEADTTTSVSVATRTNSSDTPSVPQRKAGPRGSNGRTTVRMETLVSATVTSEDQICGEWVLAGSVELEMSGRPSEVRG